MKRLSCLALLLLLAPAVARAQDPVPTATSSPTSIPGPAQTPDAPAPTSPASPPSSPDRVPMVTPIPSPTPSPTQPEGGHFEFGSYGRVRIASDLRGGTGRQTNVISHGSRVDEESYAELELRREDTFRDNIKTKIVATAALFPPFFHFSGDATQQIAIRNLYAQAQYDALTMWVGARMYRGDDIYLLDWWPLDNQNTVGGGVGYKLPNDATTIQAHVGMQRLDNAYQYQEIQAVAPFGIGTVNVIKLDRPRIVETLKVTHLLQPPNGKGGFKVIGYGEVHELSAGVSQDTVTSQDKALPADQGFMLGAELAYWTGERDTFVQLFLRHARGIAAYDPLSSPSTFANDKTTSGSSETLIALGGNWEKGPFGLLVGSYLRFFRDGEASPTSTQKFDEGTLDVRPQVYFGEHWGVAVDGSFQARRLGVLDPNTNAPLTASLWKFGVLPFFSPAGRGSYKRPQFRLIYQMTERNSGTKALYAAQDVFAQRTVEHFAGVGVEWWFNSSSYP